MHTTASEQKPPALAPRGIPLERATFQQQASPEDPHVVAGLHEPFDFPDNRLGTRFEVYRPDLLT